MKAAALALAAAVLAGCGSSPPARYFTLDAEAPAAAPAPAVEAALYSIVVGPVTVPEAVDRPQLVLRSGANRVELAEDGRWAAPLKSEIPRVIADRLAALLPGTRVATSQQRAATPPDYRVVIDIQRFDSDPGEGATVQALWTVRPVSGTPVGGRSLVTEPAGAGYEALVAAHSRALARVAADIAGAITAARSAAVKP